MESCTKEPGEFIIYKHFSKHFDELTNDFKLDLTVYCPICCIRNMEFNYTDENDCYFDIIDNSGHRCYYETLENSIYEWKRDVLEMCCSVQFISNEIGPKQSWVRLSLK